MNLEELASKLTHDMKFEFDNDKKLGHIRCQYGEKSQKANQFVPVTGMGNKVNEHNIDLKRVNKICDLLQFEYIKNYDILEELCHGDTHNKQETNYFIQDENVNYWIRLNPFGTSEYNCYIHIYHS